MRRSLAVGFRGGLLRNTDCTCSDGRSHKECDLQGAGFNSLLAGCGYKEAE